MDIVFEYSSVGKIVATLLGDLVLPSWPVSGQALSRLGSVRAQLVNYDASKKHTKILVCFIHNLFDLLLQLGLRKLL